MTFEEILDQVIAMLQRRRRVAYRTLQVQFHLDDHALEALKDELLYAQQVARDEDGRVLVWMGTPETPLSPPPHAATPLSPPAPQEAAPPPPTPLPIVPTRPEAERRQLTVLFCDLVDSTALSSQLDPEDYREVVRTYQQTCAEVIQHFDGHIAQYLGDGLLVYFGYPQAHEDDAQRAVRAGLEIVDMLHTLNTHLGPRHHVRLAVRLGIHTGLVVVGQMGGGESPEQLALGETPNLAARLQGLAAPNTVVISAATFRLTQGYFTVEELGVHALRGVAAPMAVYRILGASGVQSRLAAAAVRLTPLVGRDEEVALLYRRWAQATTGLGQVVLLSGEAGIGKSRLVQALQEHVTHTPHTRIEWRGSPYYQQSALYPVTDQLQRRLRGAHEAPPPEQLQRLEAALTASGVAPTGAVPLLAALLALPLPDAYPPLTLTPQRQRQQTLETLVAWLHMEAQRQPVLCVVEDLHWVDPSTLELLSLLIDQAATARLCLVLTARPEFHPPWPMVAHLTAMTLRRFAPAHVEQVATHVAGGKTLPPAVVAQIVAKTDGVPLFVEELTKTVLESGMLREQADGYSLPGPLLPLAIPATLHDALLARLDRLAAAKVVAQLGATIGRTFAYDLLQAVAPLEAATLQGALAQLVDAGLVAQRGVPPQATYTFKHALIRDAAYQSLLRGTRQQHHQQLAHVLETQFPETAEAQPELLAHHYTEAGRAERAVGYWQRAGRRAIASVAYVEAMSQITQGIEVLRTLPDTSERAQHELTLQLLLLVPVRALKGLAAPDAEPIFARLEELCQQRSESAAESFPIVIALWGFYGNRGDVLRARTYAEQCLTLAQRADAPPSALPKAHWVMGCALVWCGEIPAAHTHLAQALSYSPDRYEEGGLPSSPSDPTVACLTHAAFALWWSGHTDQALEHMRQAHARAQELAAPFSQAFAHFGSALLHLFRREISAVHEHTECLLALTTQHDFIHWGTYGMFLRGWVLAAQGQREAGIAQMSQAIAANRATGVELIWPYCLALVADAYAQAGGQEAGLPVLTEALALMNRHRERFWEAELHRLQGELLQQAARGTSHAALTPEACFGQALAIARRQQAKAWELRAATSLARLWQRQGQRTEAYELLAPVYGWFTEGFDTADLQDAKTLLEALA